MANDWIAEKAATYCEEFGVESGDMLFTLKSYLREAEAHGMEMAAKVAECCPGTCRSENCLYCRTARDIRADAAKDSAHD